MNAFFSLNKKIAESTWFQTTIILVIVAAGVLVGMQTYADFAAKHHNIIHSLDTLILIIFTIEVFVKVFAEGKKPWRYFMDPWNIFDFTIVAVCYLAFVMPSVDASFIAVLRLARILRVFKLVTAIPKLQMLVGALLKSIPAMGYVSILLGLLFYIYAAMAVFIYGANDPWHFGTLQTAMLTLFRVVTLEDWTDVMYINMFGCENYSGYPEGWCTQSSASPIGAALFFVSFVLIGTMIVLNLFIGVIMNSMDEVRAEAEMEERAKMKEAEQLTMADEVHMIANKIDGLQQELLLLKHRLGNGKTPLPPEDIKVSKN